MCPLIQYGQMGNIEGKLQNTARLIGDLHVFAGVSIKFSLCVPVPGKGQHSCKTVTSMLSKWKQLQILPV